MRVSIYSYPNGTLLTRRGGSFDLHLHSAWETKLQRGIIRFSPPQTRIKIGMFEVIVNSGRGNRPIPPSNQDSFIGEPHRQCVFDKPETVEEAAVATLVAGENRYFLLVNVFPVFWKSFLLIRDPSSPNEQLSQLIHSPLDILSVISMSGYFPRQLNILFNSNPGGATDSGASINHFHLHVVETGNLIKTQTFSQLELRGTTSFGKFPAWPVNLRAIEGEDIREISTRVFEYVVMLNEKNNAYNLMFSSAGGEKKQVVIIPRTNGAPTTTFRKCPAKKWGGDPYCGTIIEADPAFAAMMGENPKEAEDTIIQGIKETTLSNEQMSELDAIYRLKL